MILIIPAALGVAYVAHKNSDAERLNTAKRKLIQKIWDEHNSLEITLRDFKDDIKSSIFDEAAFRKPFVFIEALDAMIPEQRLIALRNFNYALKHNSCGRLLVFYSLLRQYIDTIQNIQDIGAIEWLEAHIGYYADMVNSLYFNAQDASYVKVASLTKGKQDCPEHKKTTLDSDIETCKSIIEFVEFFLVYYRSMIIKIAADHSKLDYQDELHKKLRFFSLVINRKSDCLKAIFDCKNSIKELTALLPTQKADWQLHRSKALLARYRSQLALDVLELYFLMILKKYFMTNEEHPIALLEEYNSTYEKLQQLHEEKFPTIFVKGTEILNYEHIAFEIPEELLQEIRSYQQTFVMPIPDFKEIFINNQNKAPAHPGQHISASRDELLQEIKGSDYCHGAAIATQFAISKQPHTEATIAPTTQAGPPLPPRPKNLKKLAAE